MFQKEWLRTRQRLLEQVKSQVRMRLGPESAALRRYAKALGREFRGTWGTCPSEEFHRKVNGARVVLSADFHAYAQAQRAHVRILRDQVNRKSVILALECLKPEHEEIAAAFMGGKISEAKFLGACRWDENWGFPFEHYRPLFELARDRGYVLKGLNTAHDLHKRDRWIAQKVREWGQANSSALIFVVIGELHLAKAHLPKLLRSGFAKTGELLTLFQDVEALYFRLAQKGRDGTDEILKSSGDRFCLMVSPPWMKWQSYLMFLEHAYDRDLQEDLAVDYSDHVASLVELLAGDLRVKVSHSRVQVYCPSSKASLRRRRWTGKMSRALKYHLEHDMSFFLPEKEWLFLSRPTINHASTLAGQFLHAQLAHRQRTLWDLPEDFLPLIWVEAVGFFFSKWINPKRKPETLESLRLQLGARRPRDAGRPALLLALDHRLSEVVWVQTGRLRRPHRRGDMAAYLEAARMVGTMLGERLFQKVRSRTISLPELMSYLKMEVGGADFAEFYWRLIRRVEGGTEP